MSHSGQIALLVAKVSADKLITSSFAMNTSGPETRAASDNDDGGHLQDRGDI